MNLLILLSQTVEDEIVPAVNPEDRRKPAKRQRKRKILIKREKERRRKEIEIDHLIIKNVGSKIVILLNDL